MKVKGNHDPRAGNDGWIGYTMLARIIVGFISRASIENEQRSKLARLMELKLWTNENVSSVSQSALPISTNF